jgi:hypothetical protein
MRRLIPSATALLCALALAACGSSNSSSSSAATGTSSAAATASSSASGTGTSASGTGTSGATSSSASQPSVGFEGVPLQTGPEVAPASTTGTGKVDGITCGPTEQLVYHIHAHLAVFKNGQSYTLPAGIGIPGSHAVQTNQGPIASGGTCIYWLHTHTTDGVIHIESPSKAIYTLGDFFDEWHQPLSAKQAGTLKGTLTAFVNGKPWKKDPRAIPLLPHENIQLQIGEPAPPIVKIDWSQTQL